MANIDLTNAVMQALTQYSDDVLKQTKVIIKEETDDLVQKLKNTSPKRKGSGSYAKGWTSKLNYENNLSASYTVYNKTDYQLTHLLEFGHANRDGSRTEGIPHIAPAEEDTIQKITKRIEKAVSDT